jgi:hypothetical protein
MHSAVIPEHMPNGEARPRATSVHTDEMVRSIRRCCAARGDSDAERDALIAEALAMPDYLHADLQAHFAEQARIFRALPAPIHRGTAAFTA